MKEQLPVLENTVPGRACWSCRHIVFITSEPGYSEYTPGSEFSLYCGRDYWTFDSYGDTLADFRRHLMSAEKCADFRDAPGGS